MFKQLVIIIAALFSGQLAFAQVQSSSYGFMLKKLLSHTVPEISVADFAQKSEQFVLLDAREPNECTVSEIKGSIPVGYNHFDIKTVENIAKDTPVLVYCSVGYRSEKIAEKLMAAGYSRVYNLYGGIFEWVNQGHPVVNANGVTPYVHAYSRTWGVWLKKGKKVYK